VPKYITKTKMHYSYHVGANMTNGIILTEDLLSAIKLNRLGYSTMALLGTKLHSEALNEILRKRYKRVLIWLDDDAAGHKAAQDIFKELAPVIVETRVQAYTQPKEVPFKRLEELILF
jgi:DNA primase